MRAGREKFWLVLMPQRSSTMHASGEKDSETRCPGVKKPVSERTRLAARTRTSAPDGSRT